MIKIAFVILNYNTSEDCAKCVDSIRKKCSSFYIIIVDNASKADDIKKLEEMFLNCKDIKILKNKENLGFAKGNNVGFRYARDVIKPRFISLINSDTALVSDHFDQMVEEAYNEYLFAVLGPDVLDNHSNPIPEEFKTKKDIDKAIVSCKKTIRILKIPVLRWIVFIYQHFQYRVPKYVPETKIDCKLSGCFLVFSKLYFFDGLCDKTFLYGEEDILKKMCDDSGLKMLYYPKIKIFHEGATATKKTISSRFIKKQLFFLKNYLESLNILKTFYTE